MRKRSIFTVICLLLIIQIFIPCAEVFAANQYITDTTTFYNAVKRGTSVIYVGDLNFEKETDIVLNYGVQIIGKSGKSVIKNVYFRVDGSNVSCESVDVVFKNVILDGGVSKNNYDFSSGGGKTFPQIFENDRTNKRCISGTWGYFSISMDNCDIRNYASYNGPAIYVDNDAKFRDGKRSVTLKNCKFYGNISYRGTVCVASDICTSTVDNCSFFENTGKEAQGLNLCNGKASVKDTSVCNNLLYRFVDTDSEGNPKNADDKLYIEQRKKYYNYVHSCGALYIGAADACVKNCVISGNHGLYGGGVGVTSPDAVAHGEKIEFIDCVIANNVADSCGGGIYARSHTGQIIRFINCNIYGNSANEGGVLFTTTLCPYNNRYLGGIVDFIFCTIAENNDSDSGSFTFHEPIMPRIAGSIELNGCFVLDNAAATVNNYSYVATKETAVSEGAVTAGDIEKLSSNSLRPKSGSKADISVPADDYSLWADMYKNASQSKKIGADFSSSKAGSNIGTDKSAGSDAAVTTYKSKGTASDTEKNAGKKGTKEPGTVSTGSTAAGVTNQDSEDSLYEYEYIDEETDTEYGIDKKSGEPSVTERKTDAATSEESHVDEEKDTTAETAVIENTDTENKKIDVVTDEGIKGKNKSFPYWVLSFLLIPICVILYILFKKGIIPVEKFTFVTKLKMLICNRTGHVTDSAKEDTSFAAVSSEAAELSGGMPYDYSAIPLKELIGRISEIYADNKLTKKETEVAAYLLTCSRRRDIADKLFVSEDTVKTHISHVFKKTGVSSKEEFRRLTDERYGK